MELVEFDFSVIEIQEKISTGCRAFIAVVASLAIAWALGFVCGCHCRHSETKSPRASSPPRCSKRRTVDLPSGVTVAIPYGTK